MRRWSSCARVEDRTSAARRNGDAAQYDRARDEGRVAEADAAGRRRRLRLQGAGRASLGAAPGRAALGRRRRPLPRRQRHARRRRGRAAERRAGDRADRRRVHPDRRRPLRLRAHRGDERDLRRLRDGRRAALRARDRRLPGRSARRRRERDPARRRGCRRSPPARRSSAGTRSRPPSRSTASPSQGSCIRDRVWRNAGAQVGDVLVLTKALGTGIVANALRKDAVADDVLAAAVDLDDDAQPRGAPMRCAISSRTRSPT